MSINKQRILLLTALGAALATAGVLVFHTVRHANQIIHTVRHARHTGEGEAIRPWMTILYIARSHQVPPQRLFDSIKFPMERHTSWPISRIARQQGQPVDTVIAELENAIAHAHGHAPPHPEVSPP